MQSRARLVHVDLTGLCLCVYECAFTHVSACCCVRVCLHACECMLCTSVFVHMRVHVDVYECVCTHVNACCCVRVCLHACECMLLRTSVLARM
jgi:hypothetical protein